MPSNDTQNIYSSEYRDGTVTPTAASDVTFDGTASGLSATNVQGAIEEVVSDIPTIPATYDADDIVYDNTTGGLTATDAQAAIDEVAGIAASKMQYIAVSQPTSIFDLIQNAEGSRIYASYAPRFTNGTDDLTTLLGVSQYARVEIFCYSKYLAVIRVVNTDGVFAIAYLDAGSTSINFMKVTTTGNSVVTVTQST